MTACNMRFPVRTYDQSLTENPGLASDTQYDRLPAQKTRAGLLPQCHSMTCGSGGKKWDKNKTLKECNDNINFPSNHVNDSAALSMSG